MDYFLDTEFIEGFDKPLFGKRRHFIDLISIGIVDKSGRTYYAVSKEFDLSYAWNDVWIRENVLKPLHTELCQKMSPFAKTYFSSTFFPFTKTSMRRLISWQGKTNNEIAQDIRLFVCSYEQAADYAGVGSISDGVEYFLKANPPKFYGYYCDYDWVLLCSLFGRMIDLPKGFPMYCNDLKQSFDELALIEAGKCDSVQSEYYLNNYDGYHINVGGIGKAIRNRDDYPKQSNEHHALADAQWNLKLYQFIKTYIGNEK